MRTESILVDFFYFIMIIRPSNFSEKLIEFNCASRAKTANKRFIDSINKEDVCSILFKYNFKCFYCNEQLNKNNWQLDHFHPRANGGLNHVENLVCTCKWCNTMKNALDGHAFINKCFNVINNNFFTINNIKLELQNKDVNIRIAKVKKKMDKLNIQYNDEFISYLKDSFFLHTER